MKEAVFTMKLEPELREAFMAEAKADHRPALQVYRELMREHIKRQQERRAYEAFVQQKVDAGRASMRAGHGAVDTGSGPQFAPVAAGKNLALK